MNTLLPYLENRSFLVKFGTLILLIGVSFVLSSILGLLLAIPFFGTNVLLSYGQGYDLSDPGSVAFLKYLQVVSQVGVFIVPSLAYAWLYDRHPLHYLELDRRLKYYTLFISVLTIVVAVPFVNYLVSWNEQMSLPDFLGGLERWMRGMETQAAEMTEAFLRVSSPGGLVVNLLIIGLLAAVGEELLFRGVILKMLAESMKNIHWAVIASALLFSAFHGQFYGFVPRAVLGIMFGYIFVFSGNLWVPILLHLLFNSVSVVVAYLYEKGVMQTSYEDFGESSSSWVIVASLVLSVSLMVSLALRSRRSQLER